MTKVIYGTWLEAGDARAVPRSFAANAARVCEIGAGANPLLPPRPGYVLLDESSEELSKAGPGYVKVVANICSETFSPPGQFDLVFSLMTAEHVPCARLFHTNVRRLLRESGLAVHFFPTLYAAPFLVNRLLPEGVSATLLRLVMAGREPEGSHGKFPARYEWCRGPSRRQITRLESCGFVIEEYRGYFGHAYYRRLGVQRAMAAMSRLLVSHPIPTLTSFALVVMRAK